MTGAGERRLKLATDAGIVLSVILFVAVLILWGVRKREYRPALDTGVPFADPAAEEPGEPSYTRKDDDRSYCLLVRGTDVATGLSDAVMLVRVSDAGNIAVMQLPRDTYVRADGRGMKLNALFGAVGEKRAEELLESALCVSIDYTAVVTTDAFRAVTDALGGVEIDVPYDMDYDDPYQDLHIHLKKGKTLLDGKSAEQFVRFRSGYADGDLGRLDAQKLFIGELLRQCRERFDLRAASAVIRDVLPLITTDMGADDAIYFAGKILGCSDAPVMITAPGLAVSPKTLDGSWYVVAKRGLVDAVNLYFDQFDRKIDGAVFDRDRIFLPPGDEDCERIYSYWLAPAATAG